MKAANCRFIDMFPRTDKRRKIAMICFRLRTKWQNCRGYVPRYERTPKNGWFDIHSVFATHVETVCLLSKLHEAKHHVSVKLDMDEMDLTSAESKATYEEIRKYVAGHSGGICSLNKRLCSSRERKIP